jgi:hypothetical protein
VSPSFSREAISLLMVDHVWYSALSSARLA